MTKPEFSPAYEKQRAELLEEEVELMRHQERVAETRRELPLDTSVDDYVLREGPRPLDDGDDDVRDVRLSQLFSAPDRTLILYHFMFGKAQTQPCPMCTMWIDGYNAVAPHVEQRADFAIVAAAEVGQIRKYARSRGWTNLRLLSAGESPLKRDLDSETEDGGQLPFITTFRLDGDGSPVLFYSQSAMFGHHGIERGIDLLSPVWNMFDLTPEGRGADWYPSVKYS